MPRRSFEDSLVAERRFRRLNSPEQLEKVYQGMQFIDGVEVIRRKHAA
jgi:hypothetical protein